MPGSTTAPARSWTARLAQKYGWKVGQKIIIHGTIFPGESGSDHSGHFTPRQKPRNSLYYNQKYVEEAVPYLKGVNGLLHDSGEVSGRCAEDSAAVDEIFRNSPQPTQDRDGKGFSTRLPRHAGQREGFHSEYLRRGGVRDSAGFGEHHGHVDSRAHAGSCGAEDSGLYAQDSALACLWERPSVLALVGGIRGFTGGISSGHGRCQEPAALLAR